MRVKLLVGLAGPQVVRVPGDEVELGDREGERLVAAGFAVPVAEATTERAVSPASKAATR